jgi:O-antigen/teichoic acid export membrane protein
MPERFLKHYFGSLPNLSQIVGNIGWLSADQLVRLGLGVFIGVWIARYLGPAQFGALSYATAFVTIIGSFASLGLQGVVVRELIVQPGRETAILGSSLLLQFAAASTATVLSVLAVQWANAGDGVTIGLVSILALSLPFQSGAIVRYWFESKVLSRYVVWVENAVFVAVFLIKLLLIMTQASLMAFAWVVLVQSVLTAAGLGLLYVIKFHELGWWKPQLRECFRLLGRCWPLALSSIAIIIYTRTDQIMLDHMCGNSSVGIYAASLRLSEVWYTIPAIITGSLFPSILALRAKNLALYRQHVLGLLKLLVAIAVLVAVVVSLAATPLVELLFGNGYEASADILRIQMWSGVFVFIGVASSSWLIAEGLQLHSFYRTACGASINVGANFILIPEYGPAGAAIATLVSQLVAAYLMDIVSPKTRDMFAMKTRAFMFWQHNFSRT